MKKPNAKLESTDLFSVLKDQFSTHINLARIRLMAMFIQSLCKVQTVNFEKIANAFDTKSLASSSLRRVQRFIAGFSLDSDLIARFIFALLPEKTCLRLTIDRTNWKFGEVDINIFMLGVTYQGVAFPLLFTMLSKRGNSNCEERIALVNRFIRLFGKECIGSLVADREFVGKDWINFLNNNNISYHIRIRNNFKVFIPQKNKELKASWLFSNLKKGQFCNYSKIVKIKNEMCYISGCKLENDFLIIISFNKPQDAQEDYRQRWQIEMCFKAMKSSGFDMEKTHLNQIKRIEKLLLLVSIAFVWCYAVGIYLHENIKKINVKKHGRKAKSIFKYGLDFIANSLLNAKNQTDINVFNFLSCT